MITRTPYEACPLCESKAITSRLRANVTSHPLWTSEFEPEMLWLKCISCGHVFTDGYFEGEALDKLFEKENPYPHSLEVQRMLCAPMVQYVTFPDEDRTWLDVGCGSGALMMTAKEFGFEVEGLDLRDSAVKRCNQLGLRVFKSTLAMHTGEGGHTYDVVSLCDVLEHVPFPRQLIKEAREALNPGGVLVVSCPNLDVFGLLPDDENPYWWELEHFHNFSGDRLIMLLEKEGFRDFHYRVSERYRLGMEIYCQAPPSEKAALFTGLGRVDA